MDLPCPDTWFFKLLMTYSLLEKKDRGALQNLNEFIILALRKF